MFLRNFKHGLSLWTSFCYRIYQEMVLPMFQKCCPIKQNKIDVEQTNAENQNGPQVAPGPTVNRQKCNALVQVALAEAFNGFESTELGPKLPMLINSVEFQDFMDEIMLIVKNDFQQQLLNGAASNSQLLPLNEAMKQKIHDKIFELGGIGAENLTAIKAVHEMTSEEAADVTIRNTIGSTSGSVIENEENHTETTTQDERNSIFPLLSKSIYPRNTAIRNPYLSIMWRGDGSLLCHNDCIWMEFCL